MMTIHSVSRVRRSIPLAATSVFLIATGFSSTVHATLAHSQTFTGWTPFASGADVTLTADTTTFHGGAESLKFVNATSTAPNNGGFYQAVPVQPSTLYHLSAWVKGSGVTASFTSNCFGLDQNTATLQCLPTGTFGWQQLTWNYTTPAGETAMAFALYSTNSGTVWFDDIAVVKDGTTTNLVTNPGFESVTDSITILSPSETIFSSGGAWLDVTSTNATINWTSADLNGIQIGRGSVSVPAGGDAYLVLPNVGPGWYSLHLTTPSGATADSTYSVVTNSYINNSTTPNPFGTNMHPWTAALAGVSSIGAAGLSNVRTDERWELIEASPGVYTFDPAEDQMIGYLLGGGVKPVVTMGYSNPLYDGGRVPSSAAGLAAYANYARAVAQHFGNRVDYDIFNEYNVPATNTSACGTTADCYYALLVPTANAIHAAAPGARVVGPTLGGFTQDWIGSTPDAYIWLKRLLDLGGLAYLDVVDFHNYTFPVVGPPEGNNDAVIAAVRTLVGGYAGGSAKPLWLTETGWPAFPGVYTALQQAQYIVRDAALSLRAGLSQYMIYDLLDDCADPTNGQCRFGMMHNPDNAAGALAPKPGLTAYAVLARSLAGYSYASSDSWGTGVDSLVFANSAGSKRRIAWAPAGEMTLAVQTTSTVTVTNWDGTSSSLTPISGIVTFSVGPDAVYIDGSGITSGGLAASAAISATPPATVHQNAAVPLSIGVHGAVTGAPVGAVTFRCAYATTTVTATSGSNVSETLTLGGFPNTGVVNVPIEVVQGSTVVGRLVVSMTVVP